MAIIRLSAIEPIMRCPKTAEKVPGSIAKASGNLHEKMIGKSLRWYRIEEKLGAGGMGVVYKAVDSRLVRTAAIKILSTSAPSAERERRFVQEAKAASSLNHPHIVTIYDIDTHEVDSKPL